MDIKLSKIVSYILRHNPDEYNINIDKEGWGDISEIILSIRNKHEEYKTLDEKAFILDFGSSENNRHVILDNKIRARYGHSLSERIVKNSSEPPEILYHGTTKKAIKLILEEGISPMTRQYVHLSADKNIAEKIASRKTANPIVIKIRAKEAFNFGINFYYEDSLWLSEKIPIQFLCEEVKFFR